MKLNKKGFTLLELLAVLVILAALATIAIPMFANNGAKSRYAANKENIARITDAVQRYELENGQPASGTTAYYTAITSTHALLAGTPAVLSDVPNSPYASVTNKGGFTYVLGKMGSNTGKTIVKLAGVDANSDGNLAAAESTVSAGTVVVATRQALVDDTTSVFIEHAKNFVVPAAAATATADPANTLLDKDAQE